MRKRNGRADRILLFAGLALLAACLVAYIGFWVRPYVAGYGVAIERNWEIDLPGGREDVYGTDTGPSFNGDGVRFHVIRWEKEEKLDRALEWSSTEGITEDGKTYSQWLDRAMDLLEVPAEQRPDREDRLWWYTCKNNGMNDILICRVGNTLYIAEEHI